MSLRAQLLLVLLSPLVLLAGLLAVGVTLPVPILGRGYVIRMDLPSPGEAIALPPVRGPQDRSRPLVVIDAGHGGHDPGASGAAEGGAGMAEKELVLQLALALRDRLVGEGGVRVALTREDDRFLALSERYDIARRLGADLFLSIHADSAGQEQGISGASIYTLSSSASSEAAARFAARENSADEVNGVPLAEQDEAVSAILVELSQRRASQASAEFADLILREGEGRIEFLPQPRRSAALAVLRAPDVPSVLFESGYISNPDEARRLASAEGRARFANAMARAIRVFFARQAPAAD